MSDTTLPAESPTPAAQPVQKPMLVSGYVCAGLTLIMGLFVIPTIIIGIVNIKRGHTGHGLAQLMIAVIWLVAVVSFIASLNH